MLLRAMRAMENGLLRHTDDLLREQMIVFSLNISCPEHICGTILYTKKYAILPFQYLLCLPSLF